MVMIGNPLLNEFAGGQMTDLPAYPLAVDPAALMEIVSPGNAAEGVNYAITIAQLGLIVGGNGSPTIILAGSSYNSVNTDTKILVDKTSGSVTTINLLAGSAYFGPVLVKDLKGDADVNPITITFPGTYDGVSSPITINTQYGYVWFYPLEAGNFYAA